jgi:hypothetical protein
MIIFSCTNLIVATHVHLRAQLVTWLHIGMSRAFFKSGYFQSRQFGWRDS